MVCETLFDQEQTAPTFVGSLEVPNVQEIVRDDSSKVPQIYIRDQQDMPKATDITHLSTDIPVIDLYLLSNDNIEELKRLDQACREWGFFQVLEKNCMLHLHRYYVYIFVYFYIFYLFVIL